jgi:hypothetical protein
MHHGRYDGIIRSRGLVFSKMELIGQNNSLSSIPRHCVPSDSREKGR